MPTETLGGTRVGGFWPRVKPCSPPRIIFIITHQRTAPFKQFSDFKIWDLPHVSVLQWQQPVCNYVHPGSTGGACKQDMPKLGKKIPNHILGGLPLTIFSTQWSRSRFDLIWCFHPFTTLMAWSGGIVAHTCKWLPQSMFHIRPRPCLQKSQNSIFCDCCGKRWYICSTQCTFGTLDILLLASSKSINGFASMQNHQCVHMLHGGRIDWTQFILWTNCKQHAKHQQQSLARCMQNHRDLGSIHSWVLWPPVSASVLSGQGASWPGRCPHACFVDPCCHVCRFSSKSCHDITG